MAKGRFNRGATTVDPSLLPPEDNIKMVRVTSPTGEVRMANRDGHESTRAMFKNEDGNMQYLVGYNHQTKASIHIVRPILGTWDGLPTLAPPAHMQGDPIQLLVYYTNDEGDRKKKVFDCGSTNGTYEAAWYRWMDFWDAVQKG